MLPGNSGAAHSEPRAFPGFSRNGRRNQADFMGPLTTPSPPCASFPRTSVFGGAWPGPPSDGYGSIQAVPDLDVLLGFLSVRLQAFTSRHDLGVMTTAKRTRSFIEKTGRVVKILVRRV